MVQVPYQPVPDVSPQPRSPPRLAVNAPPAAFGSTIAQAIEHLGSTEEQVGGELATRAVAMQQLRNETEATDALSTLERQSGDLRVKYLDSRGKNAVDGYAGFRDSNDQLRQQIRDGMSNPAAAKMFDHTALSVTNRAIIAGADHAASQNRQAAATSATTAIEAAQDSAAYAADDNEFAGHLRTIQGRTQQFGDLAGMDADSIAQLTFKNQSKAIANRIDNTARTDPVAARKMLDESIESGKLHGQDRDRVESFVHSHLMSTGARSFVDKNQKNFDDPETFLARRGLSADVRSRGVDQQFGQNMVAAITAYERSTGQTAKIDSLVRTYEEQAEIRARHEAMPGGVFAHPAAQPGTSRHEFGQAADVDSGFANWLKQSDAQGQTTAAKYGLEFLSGGVGQRDPNHVQLSGGAPLRRVRAYDIPEKDYVEGAVGQMRSALPNAPPEMEERVRQEATQLYNRNSQYDRQQDQANVSTILETLNGQNAPTTVGDLLKVPGAAGAWNQLPAKMQEQLTRQITKNPITDINERFRLAGESTHDEGIPKFLEEDIVGNPKLSLADKKHFGDLQNRLRQKSIADPSVTLFFNQVKHQIPDDVLQDKDSVNKFRGALQEQLKLYEGVYKTLPKGQDLQDMASRLVGELSLPYGEDLKKATPYTGEWVFGHKGRLFDVGPPSEEYSDIEQRVMKRSGIKPTPEQVQQIFTGELYQKLYGKPK